MNAADWAIIHLLLKVALVMVALRLVTWGVRWGIIQAYALYIQWRMARDPLFKAAVLLARLARYYRARGR